MKKISEEEYEEYMQLKVWAKKQKVYESMDATHNLREDIDLPIRKCVAMLALLGCKPIFSCCGFDYKGQPFHKAHQLGYPYIKLTNNIWTTKLQLESAHILYQGHWQFRDLGGEIVLEFISLMNPSWRTQDCIHGSEEMVIGIDYLERFLGRFKSEFSEIVTLEDTNRSHKNVLKFWQYTPKTDWVIRRDDLVSL